MPTYDILRQKRSRRHSPADSGPSSTANQGSTGPSEPSVTPYGASYKAPETSEEKLKALALRGIRTAGAATHQFRKHPNYLIIGTKRGGTTSMARWLLEHPDVRPLFPAKETRKGTYYFDVNYERGEAWYLSHFPTRAAHQARTKYVGRDLLIGEATPYYLYHPHAPIRAKRLVPDVKVIALLRNPIDRAFGHWAERSRQGIETLDFPAALDAEAQRTAGEEQRMIDDPSYVSFGHQHYSYVDQGRYSRGLTRWQEHFEADQLLLLRSEDMYADPATSYHQVLDFLGLNTYRPDAFEGWNVRTKDNLDQAMRKRLGAELAEDIAATEKLVGRPLDWL